MRKIIVTGGYGFIGSNLLRHWAKKYPQDELVCVDAMTYAAREEWVSDLRIPHVYCDLADAAETRKMVRTVKPDHVIHLAAESHVCRSIDGPRVFMESNIMGTFNLIEACRHLWENETGKHRFHHVSTDEVYGTLSLLDGLHPEDERRNEKFCETRAYQPRSPYAASKAASDHIVNSYFHTYDVDTVITNCSNNFGPNQHPEKLIPKAILSILDGKEMTVYGSGKQVRDWLYVGDHCEAIDFVFHNGSAGWSYCVGGETELSNLDVIKAVFSACQDLGLARHREFAIKHTDDRPTDDMRYAIDCSLLKSMGWKSRPEKFMENLKETVLWYAKEIERGIL